MMHAAIFWAASALAGGGPENVLLVVNPKSHASLTIANHFVHLRQTPPENLLFLPWDASKQTTDVATFRREILRPVLQAIQDRHLSDQIDYVIYSSDFPWGINLDADVSRFREEMRRAAPPAQAKPEAKPADNPTEQQQKPPAPPDPWPRQLTPVGSLNGMTFLWQAVLSETPAYFEPAGNHYARRSTDPKQANTLAFRGNRQYGDDGRATAAGGRRYFLSTMLGVTAGRGNTPAEVVNYLRRAAEADGTQPKGTIYFVENSDIRSKARQDLFPAAVEQLKALGVAAEILPGTVPLNKPDVQGAVLGTATFDWKASGSTILPGAICEHFTSFGGVMSQGAGQTPLSELLRFGAAGASGTVTEPYAIPMKFPSPMVQVHYARGCTLAEAFYQSVLCPYQLLIVGDPLCRPWAKIPQVAVEGVKAGDVLRGTATLKPSCRPAEAAERFELFLDGLRVAECKADGELKLDTAPLADGYHELRVVAVGPPPIETQGRLVLPVRVDNHRRKITAAVEGHGPRRADQPLTITVRAPGARGAVVLHGSRVVGRMTGAAGKITIPSDTLGAGPVRLRAAAFRDGGAAENVWAEPLEVLIKEPADQRQHDQTK
jgi:hypothetical protein